MKIVELQKVVGNSEIRLESDFWIKEKVQFKSVKGADVEEFSQYGTSKELNEDGRGYPVLRLNEFDSFFIHEPAKYCDIIDVETFNSLKLKKDDVLICRTNGNPKYVGKAALVPQDYEYAFASYLYRIRPNYDIINPASLVAYLNSKYGRTEIERLALVGNQANFSPAKFRQIEIPVLDHSLQQVISESVNLAYQKLQEAKDVYLRAEKKLVDELGLASWRPSHEQIAIRTLQEAKNAERIDAEYYQPKYEELFSQLDQFPTKKLGEIVDILKSIEPGSNKYLTKGIPFVRVAELTEFGILNPSVFLDKDLFEDVVRPKKNTILLSKDGSIGIAYKVIKDEDFITSSAILHLQIKGEDVLPDYLSLIINSVVVRMQAEQNSSGAIIQHWKPSEIRDVIIPILPMEKQIVISQEVINSFKLRSESKTIIEASKHAIELALEQNTQSAIRYLEDVRSTIIASPYIDITKPNKIEINKTEDKDIEDMPIKSNLLYNEPLMAAEPFGRHKWEGFDQSIRDFFGNDQTILVGCYKGKAYRDWIDAHHLYNIRMGKTKGSMEAYRELFGSTSLLVLYEIGKPDKLSAYKIVDYREIGKEELIEMGYPNKKPRKSYMSFSLEPLEMDLTFLIEHHLIERLVELNANNAKGTPVFIEP